MKNHIVLDISLSKLSDSDIISPLEGIMMPDFTFPPKIEIHDRDDWCLGYFVSFNKSISPKEIISAFQEKNWSFFNSLVGDFMIIYYENKTKQMFILTDMSGKFPFYFFINDSHFLASSDFTTVHSKIPQTSLDLDAVFDFIDWSMYISPKTIIAEIKQLPPMTLLTVNLARGSYILTPLINLNSFLADPFKTYKSAIDFSKDFLSLLSKLTAERIRSIDDLSFAPELSSGFDITLICFLLKELTKRSFVCYSAVAELMKASTDVDIMMEFAKKHRLSAKTIAQDHIFPFSTKEDLERTKRDPLALGGEDVFHFQRELAKDNIKIKFTGDGGDEVYRAHDLDVMGKFPIQETYFNTVRKLKFGADKVLTRKGIDFLLDRNRFARKRVFPQILSPSLVRFNKLSFVAYWENGIWPMQPFADPRLVQLCRGIPLKDSQVVEKQDIWRHRTDIFTPSQFTEKGGAELQANLFLDRKRGFIIKVLSKSVLAKNGFVRASEIIGDVLKGKVDKYRIWGAHVFLVSILRLEYFLQQNNVKIPNF